MAGNTAPLLGDFASVPPAKRHYSKDRNNPYPFEDMARLAKARPGTAVLAAESVPESNIKALRSYRGEPFEDLTGRIVVQMRNSQEVDGIRTGDVYITWPAPIQK